MSVLVWWLILIAMAVAILITSNFLAKAADVIAEKTGLGRSFIGVVLLATATSLPELGTGLSSILLVGEPDLAAGDAFGAGFAVSYSSTNDFVTSVKFGVAAGSLAVTVQGAMDSMPTKNSVVGLLNK